MSPKQYNFKAVFLAACWGMLLFGMVILTLGSILPMLIKAIALNELEAGSIAGLLPIGILIGSFIFGPIVDRFGYKHLIIICIWLISIALTMIGLSGKLWMLQAGFLSIGIGGGAINGGTNALVADISSDRNHSGSANLSLLGIFYGLGALGIPFILALLSARWDYSQILIILSLIIFISSLVLVGMRFPTSKHTQNAPFRSFLHFFKHKTLVLLTLFLFFQSALEGVFNNWTSTFLVNVVDFKMNEALTLLTIYMAGLTAYRIFLAAILKKTSPMLVLFVSVLILLISTFVFSLQVAHSWYNIAGIGVGIGTAAGFPIVLSFVAQLYTQLRGTAFGFALFISVIGNILINFLMGIIAQQAGLEVFPCVAVFCVLAMLGSFLFIRRLPFKSK